MVRSAKNAAQATPVTCNFQILARRPMQAPANTSAPETVRSADPLRETLPWPLPEGIQQQLASFGSIRDTEPWSQ